MSLLLQSYRLRPTDQQRRVSLSAASVEARRLTTCDFVGAGATPTLDQRSLTDLFAGSGSWSGGTGCSQ
jgi:hypothetical protein